MTTIYLIRHGEYENPEHVFPGRGPGFPLSERGRKQIAAVAQMLLVQPVVAIYASPIVRTRQTAEILAEQCNLDSIFDERLLEVRTGMEGTPMADFDAIAGNVYTPEFEAKGVETPAMITLRMRSCIDEIVRNYTGKIAICVSHGDPIRFAVASYSGKAATFEAARTIPVLLAGGYKLEFNTGGVDVAQLYPIATS